MHSPFPADTLIFAAVFAVIRTVRAVLLAVLGRILGIILRVLILGIPVLPNSYPDYGYTHSLTFMITSCLIGYRSSIFRFLPFYTLNFFKKSFHGKPWKDFKMLQVKEDR